MNKEDILKLARGAGYETSRWDSTEQFEEFLESFAHCVYTYTVITNLQDEAGQAIAREREACAKLCEARYMGDNNREDMEAKQCAKAIRNRSKQ
jgi:uncharacterized protein YecE (DUF72 family)